MLFLRQVRAVQDGAATGDQTSEGVLRRILGRSLQLQYVISRYFNFYISCRARPELLQPTHEAGSRLGPRAV